MIRRHWLALAAAQSSLLHAQRAGDSLGAARDQLVQALELMSAKASDADLLKAIGFLRRALDQDAGFGDAYYYRQLCSKKLRRNAAQQKSDLEAAADHKSEALRESRDPFHLAVPRLDDNLVAVTSKWALVVGISRFQPDVGAEPLSFAANDAAAFSEMLRDPQIGRFAPSQVFLLTNQQATTAAIKARLNTIATKAKASDLVVVYLSTHGSRRSDDLRQVSYLYTYDTDVTSRDNIFGSALPMVDVSGMIANRCLAQRTVVILDTCHSGAGAPGQAFTPEGMDRLREGAGRYVISSCKANQLSYEAGGHGYFTASLINQFRARKGCVGLGDLFPRVRAEVSETVRKRHSKDQEPMMVSSDNASDIVLGIPAGAAPGSCRA